MFPSSHVLWPLLALFTSWSSAQTFPSVAEVDLIFPRNDTYAPTVLMPVVFAIQGLVAAAPLNLASIPGYEQGNILIFTTKNGAQATDLVAATADGVCAGAESLSFNVTGLEKVSVGSGDSVTSCAVVAPMSPTSSPNPCAAQLNATGASSISAFLTASACSSPTSLVSCPAKKGGGSIVQLGRPIWVVATFGWLLYTTVG